METGLKPDLGLADEENAVMSKTNSQQDFPHMGCSAVFSTIGRDGVGLKWYGLHLSIANIECS